MRAASPDRLWLRCTCPGRRTGRGRLEERAHEDNEERFTAATTALGWRPSFAGCGGDDSSSGSGAVVDQAITVNWGAEPPVARPGVASDTTSADVISNIMDPLVKLDADLNPVPNLAESWETSGDGTTVTFHLSPIDERLALA